MNGHYVKLEIATCGLGNKRQSERLFNIKNRITGTWEKRGLKCWRNVNLERLMSGLESFRKRHEIMFNDGCGEAVNVCEENVGRLVCQTSNTCIQRNLSTIQSFVDQS